MPGGNVSLDEWKDRLAEACDKVHADQSCLKLDINYKDNNEGNKLPRNGTYTNCEVESQKPKIGARKPVGSSVHLEVSCDPPAKPNTTDGSKITSNSDRSATTSVGTDTRERSANTSKGTGTDDRSDDTKNRGK